MVAALYVTRTSVYKSMDGVDAWDLQRDARLYEGPGPVVAHPPCNAWGRFRMQRRRFWELHRWGIDKIDADSLSMACGPIAVEQVRRWGGVLEHPACSRLWDYAGMPAPCQPDDGYGWTLPVCQSWWGHDAPKPTWLYIVGVPVFRVLDLLPSDRRPGTGKLLNLCIRKRLATPPAFAAWLVNVAALCEVKQ